MKNLFEVLLAALMLGGTAPGAVISNVDFTLNPGVPSGKTTIDLTFDLAMTRSEFIGMQACTTPFCLVIFDFSAPGSPHWGYVSGKVVPATFGTTHWTMSGSVNSVWAPGELTLKRSSVYVCPEPGTALTMGMGMAGIALAGLLRPNRRRKARTPTVG